MSAPHPTRRTFVKRMTYAAPSILTLTAAPEYAKAGSAKPDPRDGGWQKPGRGNDRDFDFGRGKRKDKGASGTAPGQHGKAKDSKVKEGKANQSVGAAGAAPRASGPASPET